jgi:Rho guanine nucleotide exchange factor 4
MPKLSLEGFLLTPVQRICKYCLLLRELLKATPESHPDHASVDAACNAMRSVANDINDKKRRLESLQKIALWQRMVDGWRVSDDDGDFAYFQSIHCLGSRFIGKQLSNVAQW